MTVYQEIFEVIKERKKQFENGTAAENSYTCYLFDKQARLRRTATQLISSTRA